MERHYITSIDIYKILDEQINNSKIKSDYSLEALLLSSLGTVLPYLLPYITELLKVHILHHRCKLLDFFSGRWIEFTFYARLEITVYLSLGHTLQNELGHLGIVHKLADILGIAELDNVDKSPVLYHIVCDKVAERIFAFFSLSGNGIDLLFKYLVKLFVKSFLVHIIFSSEDSQRIAVQLLLSLFRRLSHTGNILHNIEFVYIFPALIEESIVLFKSHIKTKPLSCLNKAGDIVELVNKSGQQIIDLLAVKEKAHCIQQLGKVRNTSLRLVCVLINVPNDLISIFSCYPSVDVVTEAEEHISIFAPEALCLSIIEAFLHIF